MRKLSITLYILLRLVMCVYSHGRLMKPLSRNAMWRYGVNNPINYNDNELYCGGFMVQYNKNGGKCGVCGDNWAEKTPRKHEAGGVYGNGILGGFYKPGQEIEILSELTTNHKGWFEVKLCLSNDRSTSITQECLDKNPLPLVDNPNAYKFIIPRDSKKSEWFKWKVKLPDITCTQCVLQWKYFAGNTWGKCKNGTDSIGCGVQETFINCADIAILSSTPTHRYKSPFIPSFRIPGSVTLMDTNLVSAVSGDIQPVVRAQVCYAKDNFSQIPGINLWCFKNCLKFPPDCPPEVCICPTDCVAVGDFAEVKDSDVWCHQHCLRNPSFCPKSKCSCT